MKTLAINTTLPQTEIALLQTEKGAEEKHLDPANSESIPQKVLFHKAWESNSDEAEKILPHIKNILQKHGQPDQMFLIAGPGAFTGLRVGVTVANSLAFIYDIPIKSCTTFEYLHNKIPADQQESTAILMRAGSGVAVVIPHVDKVHKIKKDEIADFLATAPKIKNVVSDVRPDARENYQLPKGVKWLNLKELTPFQEVVQQLLNQNIPSHAIVKPQYLAPPHITKSKKKQFA